MPLLELAKDGLVHVAALLTVAAMFSKDQFVLRALLLVSTILYIVYYAIIPATPLWDAMAWSTAMVLANVFMMARIAIDRASYAMRQDEKRFYASFPDLTPGQFRRLMKLASWTTARNDTLLTREGEPIDRLYFVVDGAIEVTKAGRSFPVKPETFIGEIGFLLRRPASATVIVKSGARYVDWPADALSVLLSERPALGVAMESRFNLDLATKLAAS
jgi:hypothetical protein